MSNATLGSLQLFVPDYNYLCFTMPQTKPKSKTKMFVTLWQFCCFNRLTDSIQIISQEFKVLCESKMFRSMCWSLQKCYIVCSLRLEEYLDSFGCILPGCSMLCLRHFTDNSISCSLPPDSLLLHSFRRRVI